VVWTKCEGVDRLAAGDTAQALEESPRTGKGHVALRFVAADPDLLADVDKGPQLCQQPRLARAGLADDERGHRDAIPHCPPAQVAQRRRLRHAADEAPRHRVQAMTVNRVQEFRLASIDFVRWRPTP
jgi:hypothetical protein